MATLPATNVTHSNAVLNGSIDDNGLAVTGCYFDFGRDIHYGTQVGCA